VPADLTVQELVDRFVLGSRHSAYPVTNADGRVHGLVTLDIVRRVPPDVRSATLLRDVAVAPPTVITTSPNEQVTEVVARMVPVNARRALVLDGDDLVGIVSMTDIGRTLESRQVAYGARRRDVLTRP